MLKARLAGVLRRLAGSRCPVCAKPVDNVCNPGAAVRPCVAEDGAASHATAGDLAAEDVAGLRAAGVCADCAVELAPRLTGFCPGCGELAPVADMVPTLCAACRVTPRPWGALGFHGVYQGVLRERILALKFGSSLAGLGLLRLLLCQAYRRGCARPGGFDPRGPELVTAVPMHWRKLVARGFNQSVELAKSLAVELRVPLCAKALRKLRHTVPQSRLRAGQRRENLRQAFTADAALVRGKRILLVDDVLTTGTTLEVAVNTLLSAGAAHVEVLVLARDEKKGLTHSSGVV